ncbi:MAG TPA: hypothetical protein VIG97_04755 [Luteimonas sp.]
MQRHQLPVTLLSALLLVGCGASRPGSGAGAEATPPGFVVSTNEPFWQARVEGREVVLDGPGVQARRFAVDSDAESGGARVVVASDAAGRITIRLSPGPCRDSMSGAEFPFSGELEIDGAGAARGCARPAGMPPPRPAGD